MGTEEYLRLFMAIPCIRFPFSYETRCYCLQSFISKCLYYNDYDHHGIYHNVIYLFYILNSSCNRAGLVPALIG